MTAQEAYLLARAYTNKVAEGGGAAKGAACQIKSITAITGGHRITFEWEDNAGNVETDTMDVMDGADGTAGVGISTIAYKEEDAQGNNVYTITLTSGSTYDITCPKGPQGEPGADGQDGADGADGAPGVGIASITKTATAGLVDTYTITYTNGTTSTFTVTNGQDGDANEFIGTLAQWEALTTEQKKAYDTYQITDDYSAGSGLPNYSTTEQLTGQKWIDGKDIYFRTFTGLSIESNTAWINTNIDISYIDTIVNGVALDSAGQVITNSFGGTNGGLLLLRSLFSGNTIAKVTLYYTKKA